VVILVSISEYLGVFFPPHSYFLLAYVRPPSHMPVTLHLLFYCWSNLVLLCVSSGLKRVYVLYYAFARQFKREF